MKESKRYDNPISSERFDPGERKSYAEEAIHTDEWDMREYEVGLGISMNELRGKKILDIGGSLAGFFARQASKKGLDIVTINPRDVSDPIAMYDKKAASESLVFPDAPTKDVRGMVQALPFEDNTFDYELAAGTVPLYLPQFESEYREMFKEVIRTLKPGGTAIFWPIKFAVRESPIFKRIVSEIQMQCLVQFEEATFREDRRSFRMKIIKPEFLF